MNQDNARADQLFKLVYSAASQSVPNLGGHHGIHGMMRGLREDLLKQTGQVCGTLKQSQLSSEDLNNYLALCKTAVATEVIAESDLTRIESILEEV